jgi:hypothetical protein
MKTLYLMAFETKKSVSYYKENIKGNVKVFLDYCEYSAN